MNDQNRQNKMNLEQLLEKLERLPKDAEVSFVEVWVMYDGTEEHIKYIKEKESD